jgi:hypothetical protein
MIPASWMTVAGASVLCLALSPIGARAQSDGTARQTKSAPSAARAATTDPVSLVGVWRFSRFRENENAPSTSYGSPSLVIFTKDHYSIVAYDSLPDFGDRPLRDAEKARLWDGFFAHAGTYELDGDRLVLHPVVAKNPFAMKDECALQFTLTPDGSGYWMHQASMCQIVIADQGAVKLERIE